MYLEHSKYQINAIIIIIIGTCHSNIRLKIKKKKKKFQAQIA